MSRYIDREAVLKIIGDNCPHDKCGYNTEEEMGAGVACYHIMKDVEALPPADVVEVVRCRDCRRWKDTSCDTIIGEHWGECRKPLGDYRYCEIAENDYCSYGERIEE